MIEYGEDGFASALDLARASRPETILAQEVNREILPATLGFPVRVIAPGVYGLRQVMWLRRLEVMGAGFQDYVVSTLHLPPDPEMVINSELQYPPAGTVFTAGEPFQLFGYAVVDGLVGVETVELSFEGMQTWLPARLYRNKNPSAWVLWGIEWVPHSVGPIEVSIRATDISGESQPVEDNDFSDGYNPIQTLTFDVVPRSGDLTKDGLVNWKDLFLFMQQWQRGMNQVPPAAGLPVPSLLRTPR